MQPSLKVFLVLIVFASSLQLSIWIGRYLRFGWMLLEDLLINQQFLEPYGDHFVPTISSDVHAGYMIMKDTNVSFLGVGRNLGSRLPKVLAQIDLLAQQFQYSRVIFAEGGSTDDTKAILRQWSALSPFNRTIITVDTEQHVEEQGHFQGQKMPREGRLAEARNVGLRTLYQLPSKTEYVIIIDLDVLGWDPVGVADSFARMPSLSWDVMCANGILLHGVYRDTYAFRTEKLDTNHHWAGNDQDMYNITLEQKKSYRQNLRMAQRAARTMMDFSNLQGVIRVHSCFGGLAIYRFDALYDCQYAYRHNEAPFMLDCEHVLLHKCMIKKHHAKIYANSKMKLWYGHNPIASWTLEKVFKHVFLTS